jgi:protein prenyltransferase alpha subunit repeat containing protein 1
MVLSAEYGVTKLKDELQLCALILSYSPKNESTWSHRYTPSCTREASFLADLFLSDNSYVFGADFDIIKQNCIEFKITVCHRRWVIKQVAEQHQDMLELIGNESILVKEIAEVITHEYLLIQAVNSVNLTELTIL